MQADTPPVAYFGKLPTFADFARYQATSPAWTALDEWVQRGIQRFAGSYREILRQASDRAAPVSFAFAPDHTDTVLVGVMRPSQDQAGRFYPFILAHEEPRAWYSPDAALLPVQARPFMEAAARFVEEAAQGTRPYRSLDEALPAVEQAAANGLRASSAEHDAYLRRTTLKAFVESIWGDFEHGGKYVLFKNLLDILATLRQMDRIRLTYGLVFPLGSGADAAHAASFWWALCQQLLPPGQAVAPTCFWPAPTVEAADPRLTLFLNTPLPDAFSVLLAVDAADPLRQDNDALCELERIEHGSASDAVLALPPNVGAMIESEDLTLSDVLNRMTHLNG